MDETTPGNKLLIASMIVRAGASSTEVKGSVWTPEEPKQNDFDEEPGNLVIGDWSKESSRRLTSVELALNRTEVSAEESRNEDDLFGVEEEVGIKDFCSIKQTKAKSSNVSLGS